jgi:hypothetical protein
MHVQPDDVRNEILTGDVRYWPKADIASAMQKVRTDFYSIYSNVGLKDVR